MSIPTLSKSGLEAARVQNELHHWVMRTLHEFASTAEGKTAFRLNKGNLVKQFVEELFPLMLFADGFYSGNADVLFRLAIGNQSCDALVIGRARNDIVMHLQITQSFDGYENHSRKLHLTQHGSVPITADMPAKDKKTGTVKKTRVKAVDHQKVLAKTFAKVKTAVERKSKMRYEEGTSLIVNVESFHFLDDSDVAALHDFVRRKVAPIARNFAHLYLVSDKIGFAYAYATRAA